jgi:hypothetical protein
MTTAYTSLLGLALPVTGELSGTWGDTVNNSITSLLDSAVAGATTITADANITLSTTTGAANESRQAIIIWTASGTVTRTITAPAQSKVYTVINKSSTQSIKIVGVGPTTGVTIRSGVAVTVAWDGTDFKELSIQTLYPTVTISGNMDNGATDYSLTNTPTVTSAVTTQASIYRSFPSTAATSFTLTDLIGYRADQGTIGATSAVTNQYGFYANSGLTGATNNIGVYSGIAASAAATITGINGNGSIVTVTTAAAHGLVTGDSVIIANVPTALMLASTTYNGGPRTVTFISSTSFSYASTSTSSAPVTSGNTVKANNWNFYSGGTGNNWFGGPTMISASSTLPALRVTQTGTGYTVLIEDSSNTDVTPFAITAAGLVGIGTTLPTNALSVSGNVNITGNVTLGDASTDTVTVTGVASFADGTVALPSITNTGDTNTGIFFPAADTIAFSEGGVESMRITSAGNVGMGITAPLTSLHVNYDNAAGLGASLLLSNTNSSGATGNSVNIGMSAYTSTFATTSASYRGAVIAAETTVAGNGHDLIFSTNTTSAAPIEKMRITYDGNVGIGTSSPTLPLDAQGVLSTGAVVSVAHFGQDSGSAPTIGQGARITLSANNSKNRAVAIDGIHESSTNAHAMVLYTNANGAPPTEKMRITSAGRVLVGTTSAEATNYDAGTPIFQVASNSSSSKISVQAYSATLGPALIFQRSTSSTVGTLAVTADGDTLGAVGFEGVVSVSSVPTSRLGAYIAGEQDGTAGANFLPGRIVFQTASSTAANTEKMRITSAGNVLVTGPGGLGYGTGSGGTVTQATSRTTGVTLNKTNGAITLVSAAGSAVFASFTVTNSTVAATDVVRVTQKSGTDLYQIFVTATAAGSFRITFATTGGTTTEQPVFNFAVMKAVTA